MSKCHFPNIDMFVVTTTAHGILFFIDCFSGYNQVGKRLDDPNRAAFKILCKTWGSSYAIWSQYCWSHLSEAVTSIFHDMFHNCHEEYMLMTLW